MGLTIHYTGNLKKASDLKSMIDEVIDIAKINNWEHFTFEEKFENDTFSQEIDRENLFGVMVSPNKSEPLCFSFLSNGKISGLINFNVMQMSGEINEDLLYSVATKTQYSGFENHKKLILLLDYVNSKYLENFECYDEGEYWETRDEELLIKNFEKNGRFIDSFQSSMEMIPLDDGESVEDYLIRLAEITNKNQE